MKLHLTPNRKGAWALRLAFVSVAAYVLVATSRWWAPDGRRIDDWFELSLWWILIITGAAAAKLGRDALRSGATRPIPARIGRTVGSLVVWGLVAMVALAALLGSMVASSFR
jgi:hypothetical protein